ncbi:hypothetical protein [Mycetohabitans endofungorum]|uniref:hypothetical protein n=1 Tax=Mycetohabitans endofungorum TaxID=417203 RepID=UPI001E60C463|nr:hypothetical protein [Mycetohabitans endofungorum]
MDQWIAVAVAEKIGAVETAAAFLSRRAGHAQPADLLPFLDKGALRRPPLAMKCPFKHVLGSMAGKALAPVGEVSQSDDGMG